MDKVTEYIETAIERQDELRALRELLLASGMEEKLKWGMPCYCIKNKNVIGLAAFKNWTTLWFHKGAYLEDDKGYLVNAQEGKTKEMRHWRFSNLAEIEKYTEEISDYIESAKGYFLE